MKAQAAFEYMAIAMLVLGFLIPIWIYMTGVQTQSKTEMSLSYSKLAVERVAETADFVYSQGPPANMKIRVYVPSGIESYMITNDTIDLKVRYGSDLTDIFAMTKANLTLTATFPTKEGTYWINIEAVENYVNISY
jgi:uncharacterized protein (UPF0333 family)